MIQGSGGFQPNLSWVRTAAQAAVALRLHGVLETTGLPSASARLQHASLPKFDNSRDAGWMNDDADIQLRTESDESPTSHEEENFEEGVLQVQDGLDAEDVDDDSGYDLLPLPVPTTERRILTYSDTRPNKIGSKEVKEERFRYGESPPTFSGLAEELGRTIEDGKPALLGDIAVDENIDKLREVIGSVDHTLSRCLASSGAIGSAHSQRMALHLDIVRGLDLYEGLKGKFVSQRALLKGVSGIDQSREIYEESDICLIDGEFPSQAVTKSSLFHTYFSPIFFLNYQMFPGKQRLPIRQYQHPKTSDQQYVQQRLHLVLELRPRVLQFPPKKSVTQASSSRSMKLAQQEQERPSHRVMRSMPLSLNTKQRLLSDVLLLH